jgi:small-conductance mechanosensitive channel
LTSPSILRALLAIGLITSGVVPAAAEPVGQSGAEGSTAPDFGKGAEEVAARLRELARSLSDTGEFAVLEAEVAADTHRAAEYWDETGRRLARGLRTTALDSLTTTWQALHSDLEDVNGRIEERARRREADLATLTALHDSWTRALDLGQKADAPPSVLDRVRNTVAAIDAARPAVEQRRARVLVLQDSVSRALQTCDDALSRIDDARREAIKRAFTTQEPPVWHRGSAAQVAPGGARIFDADIAGKLSSIRLYVKAYPARLAASMLIVFAVMVWLHRMRARPGDRAAAARGSVRMVSVVHTPYAAAFLIGLLLSRPLRPNPPFEFQQVMLVVCMWAAVLVFRPILEKRLAVAVYVCGVLLVLNVASQLLEPAPGIEQVLLIVEMSMAGGVILWGVTRFAKTRQPGDESAVLWRIGRALAYLLALGCCFSALAAALGYLDLADFLGLGLFFSLILAFGCLAVRLACHDLVTVGLSQGPLARLHAVSAHRDLVDRRMRGVIDVLIFATWTWFVLNRFQLFEPARDLGRAVLDTRLRAGELDLPVAHLVAFVAVVIGVFVTTRVVAALLEEDVYSRMTLPRGVPYALSTLTRYGLLLAGFLLALATLGLDLTRITVLVSALGLGLGFGLQQIMNNFVSGLILLFERPVKVGDSIQMGDLSGDVLRIGIRSSTVRTSQGAEVIVPNSKMIEEKVTNWTLSDRRRRIELDIGIKGSVDAERIIAILNEVAGRDARVSPMPPPEALLLRFADDGTDFQLRFWTDETHWMRLRSDLSVTLQRTLRAARIDESDPSKEYAKR